MIRSLEPMGQLAIKSVWLNDVHKAGRAELQSLKSFYQIFFTTLTFISYSLPLHERSKLCFLFCVILTVIMLLPSVFKLASQALLTTTTITSTRKPTVYFIRHGEKPSLGNGLNAEGLRRAECLRDVFGRESLYNISHIIAQTPQPGCLITMLR